MCWTAPLLPSTDTPILDDREVPPGATQTVTEDNTPRDYDRLYQRALAGPLQIRVGLDVSGGEVTRFLVQLEYRRGGSWDTVVRYDHDAEGSAESSHDVTEEGLHIDIYRDGEKHVTEYVVGPRPAGIALDTAEDHLAQNLERFVERYERWHDIRKSR